mmetsp:Transcript_24067/g.58923  ORF Transcript_24067/g.58923 Transcript_24067/m.58923 type:complete len:86 (-) Transcript_24067:109-366(-)
MGPMSTNHSWGRSYMLRLNENRIQWTLQKYPRRCIFLFAMQADHFLDHSSGRNQKGKTPWSKLQTYSVAKALTRTYFWLEITAVL